MIHKGIFFNGLLNKNQYDLDLRNCMTETVKNLLEKTATQEHPGMLLGKIQSGKTKAFLGVMGLAFDNGFDIAVILTKNSVALAEQTINRLKNEFSERMEEDQLQVFDVLTYPGNLTRYELEQKIVFVVKKERRNMEKLHQAFFEVYPQLREKKVLIIDDEADFGGIGFVKSRTEGMNIKKIAGSINELRSRLNYYSYLQVTATPYSLYLQPNDLRLDTRHLIFKPIRPSFTVLVPVHKQYIGGEYYFEESEEQHSIASYLYESVDDEELMMLKQPDRKSFRIDDCLTSAKVKSLRNAILNFIVGGCVRRLQDQHQNKTAKKYSFIIHTEQGKTSHGWQEDIVFSIKIKLAEACYTYHRIFHSLVEESYINILRSASLSGGFFPDLSIVKAEVKNSLQEDYLMISVVNSEKEVQELLDQNGQLKLRTPLNIFIGGQILDRGITITNLIGFYYGRRPKTYQQDTVLQHSRMYGARPIEDLAVTRFYTTDDIYSVMKRIHEFDSGLRQAFLKENQDDNGVVFIHKDTNNKIIPCSPNKIMLSTITTIKPGSRLLPVGFEVKQKNLIEKIVDRMDEITKSWTNNTNNPALVAANEIVDFIVLVNKTYKDGHQWDCKAFNAAVEYMSSMTDRPEERGKLWVVVRKDRDAQRVKQDGRPENSPDSYQEKGLARELAIDIPAIVLLRQNGDQSKGWSGTPFWWPVLVAPNSARTIIFTGEQIAVDDSEG